MVQSSGFGKSRILKELAIKTMDAREAMKVFYFCARRDRGRSWYEFPRATTAIRAWLFPAVPTRPPGNDRRVLQEELANRLVQLYAYAVDNWDEVGSTWFTLFTARDGGESVLKKMQGHIPSQIKGRTSRVVLLVVDEGGSLLDTSAVDSIGWFRRLRRALQIANETIATSFGVGAGVFAVLVNANPRLSTPSPPIRHDGSCQETPITEATSLFPQFVLTQTVVVAFDTLIDSAVDNRQTSVAFYQQIVCTRNDEEAWRYLVRMGRPLWLARTTHLSKDPLIDFASTKLLNGASHSSQSSYSLQTLFGVAAMLCRLGLRPHSWSPFPSQMVTDFMAVMAYLCRSREQFVSTYSSEPLLTFGAARVWRPHSFDALGLYLLPQLRKFLHQEVMDTGSIGGSVARLVFLLAMDATGEVASKSLAARCYSGEFHDLCTFLRVLHGDSSTEVGHVMNSTVTPETVRAELEKEWSGWKIGFSHFVQLVEEPDEKMLWVMLARRAAGAFHRNFNGVDLIISIFSSEQNLPQVSVILVQVKNREAGDPAFPESASIELRPSIIFSTDLRSKEPWEVVRVYMSLRSLHKPSRFYLYDTSVRQNPRGHHGSKPAPQ